MISLIVWTATLLILLWICNLFSRHVLLTPQFCYVGCFLPQAVFSFYFVSRWNAGLSVETMFVLISGTLLFVVASIACNRLLSKSGKTEIVGTVSLPDIEKRTGISVDIQIERWKLVIFLLFQIVVILLFVTYGFREVSGSTFIEKMRSYNDISKFGDIEDAIRLPPWINWPRIACEYSAYLFSYLLIHCIVFKYKQKKVLLLLNLTLGLFCSFLTGGRIAAVKVMIALVIQAYFIWGTSTSWQKRISAKYFFAAIGIGIIILFSFQWSAQFLGRSNNRTFVDYLGVYISDPLRNLNTFVQTKKFGNPVSNWETLFSAVNFIGSKFGIDHWVHQHDMPFLRFKGVSSGNVYTTYYDYLHDGGYLALVGFVLLEAFVMQIALRNALKTSRYLDINLYLLFYSYFSSAILLSFFMNQFYPTVFSIRMVQLLLCCWFLRYFFTRFHFSNQCIFLTKTKSWPKGIGNTTAHKAVI